MRAEQCLIKLLLDYDFHSVLDIGSGDGRASRIFKMTGKDLTNIDINPKMNPTWVGDFKDYPKRVNMFDCIWCSHVLEHQLNVNAFLAKILYMADKVVAITVPPAKSEIVGGHYTTWNMGILIYNMVMAGFDCTELIGIKQGYNISIITSVKYIDPDVLKTLNYDKGDIETLQSFFPKLENLENVWQAFNGDIQHLRWYSDEVTYE